MVLYYIFFTDTILVYGATLHAYCCIATLQKIGISSKNITFVEPFPSQTSWPSVRALAVPEIDNLIQDQLAADNIKVYCGYYYIGWEYDPKHNVVKNVTFESNDSGIITLDALAVFWYSNKNVDFRTFKGKLFFS